MSNEGVDGNRRRFLTAATSVFGAAGAAAVAWPFLASLKPSARARALGAPVIADISTLEPGMRATYLWRGQPIWIVRRTPEMLASLDKVAGSLVDPDSKTAQQPAYITDKSRALKPEFMVMKGVCTHLGCVPLGAAEGEVKGEYGGYFCPCHGSSYDTAARIRKGPAPTNLVVPPYEFTSDTAILVG